MKKTSTRENFDIEGYFYHLRKEPCRKFLNIKRKKSGVRVPDLNVIMMNPGSSRQAKGFEKIENQVVPTIPDNTQDQIMRLMSRVNPPLNFARVINLSDLREKNSNAFYGKLKNPKIKTLDHSIFSKSREDELKQLFTENAPVLLAWGINENLQELANKALTYLHRKKFKTIGFKKENSDFGYYHPLLRKTSRKGDWLSKVLEKFK